jgi:hypothetical protein
MTDVLEWLAAHANDDPQRRLHRLGEWLGRSSRPLATDWWHANDLEAAYEWAARRLGELCIDPPDRDAFEARHELVAAHVRDEEEARRHQLGFVAVHANAGLDDRQRFYCLGMSASWETGEPPWILATEPEYAALRELTGAPPALEADYATNVLPAPARYPLDVATPDADLKSREAFDRGDYALTLAYLAHVSKSGDHGLLAQLLHIETLRRMNRRDDATALWLTTADEWMRGERRVWASQWKRLRELHGKLRVSDDDGRIAAIRALEAGAPQ